MEFNTEIPLSGARAARTKHSNKVAYTTQLISHVCAQASLLLLPPLRRTLVLSDEGPMLRTFLNFLQSPIFSTFEFWGAGRHNSVYTVTKTDWDIFQGCSSKKKKKENLVLIDSCQHKKIYFIFNIQLINPTLLRVSML